MIPTFALHRQCKLDRVGRERTRKGLDHVAHPGDDVVRLLGVRSIAG